MSNTISKLPHQNFIRSELDLFDQQSYDLSIVSTQVNTYHPSGPLSNATAPIEFNIAGSDTGYIDLAKTKLYMRCKVTQASGAAVAAGVKLAPINNICHSAFSQCAVYLNETLLTSTTQMYAFRAYLERLLSTGLEFNSTQALLAGYFKEQDPEDNDETGSDSFGKRYTMAAKSNVFEVVGRPHSDIFTSCSYLPPGVNMRVVFTRASDPFVLHCDSATAGYKFVIEECKLQVTRYKIQPQVSMSHIKMWEQGKIANFPLTKVDIKSYGVSTGTREMVNENLITGELPSRILVALVRTDDLIGNMTTNPFRFSSLGLKKIGMYINSDQNDGREIEVNFTATNLRIKEAVHNLYRSLGIENRDCSIDFTADDFQSHRAIYAFDVDPVGEGIAPPRFGNIKIDLQFDGATTEAITVLVYTENPTTLHIDKHKRVYFSGST